MPDNFNFVLPPALSPYALAQMVAKASETPAPAIVAGYEAELGTLVIATVGDAGITRWGILSPLKPAEADEHVKTFEPGATVRRIQLFAGGPSAPPAASKH